MSFCSRTIPTLCNPFNHKGARIGFRPWLHARCRSYIRSFVPALSIIPHIRPPKFQPFRIPQFFKHPLHEAYDLSLVVTYTIGQVLKWASCANQGPLPSACAGAKVASQDAAELTPFGIGDEITGARPPADERSTPFKLHHFSGSP